MTAKTLSRMLAGPVLVSAVAFTVPVAAPASILVDSADDVCPASTNRCVVAQDTVVAAGSELDFGVRELRIEGAGVLDFGAGSARIRCGRFDAAVSGAAIRTRGDTGDGTAGGHVELLVGRSCSLAPAVACLSDSDCTGAGTCSGGDGSATIDGSIAGSADRPGHLTIRAAGDIVLRKTASISGTRTTSDGGSLLLQSTQASVLVSAPVLATGGGVASGGELSIFAAVDVVLDAPVSATGGDYDGGTVTIVAGRNVSIRDDIDVDSTGGAGFGGEIDVSAAGDLTIEGGGPSNNLTLGSDGHESAQHFGGDGGSQTLAAGRNLLVSRYVHLSADGAAPDGFADSVSLLAGGDLRFDASVSAKGRGLLGGGGFVELASGGRIVAGDGSAIDATGPAAGGDVALESGGDLECSAVVDVSGGSAGVGGRVTAIAGGDAGITGAWSTAGSKSAFSNAELVLEACHVLVAAPLVNSAGAGRNRITARESLTIAPEGSMIAAGSPGANAILLRTAARPPLLQGLVSPAATVAVDDSLAGCPFCGDAEVDAGETCDNGNPEGGDGCSARCQDEGCEAATAGYPSVPLCSDGSECTRDWCDASGHLCVHAPEDCSDGIACTLDSCEAGRCTHQPRPQQCDDGNACTADDCSAQAGCLYSPRQSACDDGVFCNGADRCSDGTCSGHDGDPCAANPPCRDACDESRRSCLVPAGAACSGDANPCTDDACDGSGLCVHVANGAGCDDGLFCNGADSCRDGACLVHAGDPCAAGSGACAVRCEEDADSCLAAVECADDGNPCTLDVCDGAGDCVHEPAAGACDDADFCTQGDVCNDGTCGSRSEPSLSVSLLRIRPARSGSGWIATWKATYPAGLFAAAPWDADVRVVLTGAMSRVLLDAVLAADSFTGADAAWRFEGTVERGTDGIAGASLKIRADGSVSVRMRMEGAGLSEAAAAGPPSLALLPGGDPAVTPCASSNALACVQRRNALRCEPVQDWHRFAPPFAGRLPHVARSR